MAGRQRDEPRVFVHLAHHVLGADDAEAARVEQAHLDALGGQRHPRIDVRRIIVVVNQDVVAAPEFQPGGDEAQRERGRPDERDFVRLAVQQLRAELARVVEPVQHEGFLIAERGLPGAIGDGVGHAARQRADAGVREKYFVARDGEFRAAQFLVGQDFGQCHAARLMGKAAARKKIQTRAAGANLFSEEPAGKTATTTRMPPGRKTGPTRSRRQRRFARWLSRIENPPWLGFHTSATARRGN